MLFLQQRIRLATLCAVTLIVSLSTAGSAFAQHSQNHVHEYQEPPTLMERLSAMQRSLKSRISRTVKPSKDASAKDETQSAAPEISAAPTPPQTNAGTFSAHAGQSQDSYSQSMQHTRAPGMTNTNQDVGFANYQSPSSQMNMGNLASQIQLGLNQYDSADSQMRSPSSNPGYDPRGSGLQMNPNGHYVSQPAPPNSFGHTGGNFSASGYPNMGSASQFDPMMQNAVSGGPAMMGQHLGQPGLTATEYALQLKQLNESLRQNLTSQTAKNEQLKAELESTRDLLSKANIAMTEANQELNRLYDENRKLQNEVDHLYSQRSQEQHRTDRMLQSIRDELDDVLMREISTPK